MHLAPLCLYSKKDCTVSVYKAKCQTGFRMKFFLKSIFILLFINFNLVAQGEDLKSLVDQLGAENYQDRETATNKLWKMGKKLSRL